MKKEKKKGKADSVESLLDEFTEQFNSCFTAVEYPLKFKFNSYKTIEQFGVVDKVEHCLVLFEEFKILLCLYVGSKMKSTEGFPVVKEGCCYSASTVLPYSIIWWKKPEIVYSEDKTECRIYCIVSIQYCSLY